MNLPIWLTQFHFIRPLWLLLLIPLAWLIYLRYKDQSESNWSTHLPAHLRQALTLDEQGWRSQLPLKLLSVSLLLAVIICAGPTWQREASPFGEDKASMLVILDNSESMLQTDLAPNRIERVKHKIHDLLMLRAGGKTGLLVFAGSAHLAMPATPDSAVFAPFLAAIEPSIMPKKGKQAQSALSLINEQLNNIPGSSVLLISDGISPQAITAYQEFFTTHPYQLLILAAGNSALKTDQPLDDVSLKALAQATGGRLFDVTVDNSDVQALNRAIDKQMQLSGDSAMPWQDMGYALLFPLLFLTLLWFRKGWLVQWCLVGAVLISSVSPLPVSAAPIHTMAEKSQVIEKISMLDKATQYWLDLWLTPDQQGQRLFKQKSYLEAAKHYSEPMQKGKAYYYAGEYKLAHALFLQAENDLGLYYCASALARQREYLAARDLLNNLLQDKEIDPTLKIRVKHNFQILDALIDEINRFSESQIGNQEVTSFELADEQEQTAEGADEQITEESIAQQQINAQDLLQDEQKAELWFKRVQSDPKRFLAAKFQIQLREQNVRD